MVSPSVDLDESSATRSPTNADRTLNGLRDAPHIEEEPCVETKARIEIVDDDASEWESDAEILRPKATEDDDVPNGPDPVVPLNPREPDAPIRGVLRSEVERIADESTVTYRLGSLVIKYPSSDRVVPGSNPGPVILKMTLRQ